MRRHGQTSREPALFDLPLVVDPGLAGEVDRLDEATRARSTEPTAEAEQIELTAEPAAESSAELPEATGGPALVRRRLQAGIIDGAVAAAGLAALLYGAAELGAPASLADWPAYLLVILEFTFVYAVFSVAFWGRTPGMARAGLIACADAGQPLTLGQAVRRWLGGVATLALLGLPALGVLRARRSLADYLSGSRTEAS